MFCPQCGAKQSDELKFCNLCGANLFAVRQAVATRETDEKFDRSKTWVAERFPSEAERKKRTAALETERGVTVEVRRYHEIKAGVMTSFVGIGVAVFLFNFMEALIRSEQNPPGDYPILRAIWIAGVIPIMVGLALVVNGLFVSRKLVEIERRERQPAPEALNQGEGQRSLRSADTSEFVPPDFSVTDGTTKHLSVPDQKQ